MSRSCTFSDEEERDQKKSGDQDERNGDDGEQTGHMSSFLNHTK